MVMTAEERIDDVDRDAADQRRPLGSSRRSLVLNATFEPISVVSWRRAIVLVVAGRAECVETDGAAVRSERLTVEVPSVVRLTRYVRVPHRRHAPLSRRAVLVRDRWTCQYCGARADGIDHVQPRSRDGAHAWDNVVAACRSCNARKGDRLLSETRFRLRTRPTAPPAMSAAALALRSVPSTWASYLPPDRPALSA
ncbi:MAG: HNH endonuclease [Actinomycetota bacterium]